MQTILDRKEAPSSNKIKSFNLIQAKKNVLDNGIPVYSINAGYQDLAKIEFIFPNISFDLKRPLLNSATNRLMSEGTSKYTSQQLADHIDYYGSFFETEENSDFTSVILFTLNKHLEATLPFIRDLIQDPVFPESEVGVYVQNSKQQLVVDNERTSSITRRKFNEIIFGEKHPYGYYVKGDDFDTINRENLIGHHKNKYIPQNCTIIISGVVKDETIKILNKFFGNNPRSVSDKPAIEDQVFSSSSQKKHLVERKDAVQSGLRIGKPFFNRRHPDYPGMAVVNTLLGGFFGSRLMSNIREEKGYTYSIGSAIVSMKQEGYFFISTEVGVDVTAPAIEEIYNEIELLTQEYVEYDELEMARNYMLGSFLKGVDGAFQLAERFKSIYLYDLDYSYYEKYMEKIRTIQPDEIKDLACKYFEPSGFYELVVGRK